MVRGYSFTSETCHSDQPLLLHNSTRLYASCTCTRHLEEHFGISKLLLNMLHPDNGGTVNACIERQVLCMACRKHLFPDRFFGRAWHLAI